MQLDKQDMIDVPRKSKDRSVRPAQAALLGAMVAVVLAFAVVAFLSEQSLNNQIAKSGIALAPAFLWRSLINAIAGALTGIAVAYVCSKQVSMAWRFCCGGGLGGFLCAVSIGLVLTFDHSLFVPGAWLEWIDFFDDIFFLLVFPGFNGAWVGAILGLSIWLTFTRQKIGPLKSAFGTAVCISVLSAIGMILFTGLTSPGGDSHGSGIGAGAGHAISMFFVYIYAVLPISIAAGGAVGWHIHRS